MEAVKVLRKEPWLSDDEVKAVGAGFVSELGPGVVDELKKASSWDLARARRVVMDECAEEVEALVAAGALDSEAGRVRVRVMIGCMVMLVAGCRPSDIDEELVLEHAGPTYLEYFGKRAAGALVLKKSPVGLALRNHVESGDLVYNVLRAPWCLTGPTAILWRLRNGEYAWISR